MRLAVFWLGLLIVAAPYAAQGEAADDSGPKPNVIWILLDACRAANLSCYGYERQTSPHIDALAEKGVLFEQCFAQSTFTTVSVPSYMTGRYFPVECFVGTGWRFVWRTAPEHEVLLPAIMGHNGYATCMVTAHPWMTPEDRLWRSFQESSFVKGAGQKYASLEQLIAQTMAWLAEKPSKPFFLYIHALDTHWPHLLEPPFDKWIDPDHPRPELARLLQNQGYDAYSAADHTFMRGLHDGSILYTDTVLGAFFDQLKARGLFDNTIVILGADHGEALGNDGKVAGHPAPLTADDVLHVPLIMAGPNLPEGRRVSPLVENADIVPTLIDALALETAARPDGKSLLPLASGKTAAAHKYTFAKYRHYGMDDYGIILRDNEYKYVFCPETNVEELWTAPDHVGNRKECLAEAPPSVVARMQRYVNQDIMPLWKAYRSLPHTTPTSFTLKIPAPHETGVQHIGPLHSFQTRRPANKDGKWHLEPGLLESCGFLEDAPPITFRLEAPNAVYRIELGLTSHRSYKDSGKPASAVLFKAQGDEAFKEAVADAKNARITYQDIGQYAVQDGVFQITFDEGDTQHWAVVREIRFVPRSDDAAPALSVEEETERLDQLRALGYLQ